MALIDTILKRKSIRKYTDDTIPEDKLNKILQAGLLAPTSRNIKPCEIYIVKDKDVLKKLAGAKKAGAGMLTGCNAAVVVLADSEKADTWIEDSSIAMSFMMLMAEEQGIGNCWVQIHMRSRMCVRYSLFPKSSVWSEYCHSVSLRRTQSRIPLMKPI